MNLNPTQVINELLFMLSFATDIEDNRKVNHSKRVAVLSLLLAEKLLTGLEKKSLLFGALLHDIGGVGFPLHIIHYLNRNNNNSQNILLSHSIIGAQLTSLIPGLNPSARLILDHHEWINGGGYPRARTKEDIFLGSQIIRIADSVDMILRSSKGKTFKSIEKVLISKSGKEFSKSLASKMLTLLKKDSLLRKLKNNDSLEIMLAEIRNKVGLIKAPGRVDAIGTTLEVIAQVSDMKHPYTYGHSLRVSRYCLNISLSMNLAHDEITFIKWAGLMHDIGKLSISRDVLDKPSALNQIETLKIREHARMTEEILKLSPSLKEVALLACSHHEYFDGSGYPKGLKGKSIPLGTRIISISDAFDAMTSNRPYRDALAINNACAEIEKKSGTQFDPEIVKIAIPIFKNLSL